MDLELNKPIIGKVINRNFTDLSITLKLNNVKQTSTKIVINLIFWLQSQQNKDGSLLPHTNDIISVKNIKFIKTIATKSTKTKELIDYYIGNDVTVINILKNDDCLQNNLLDDFVTLVDMLNVTHLQNDDDLNLVEVMEQHNLKQTHLEIFLRLSFPNVSFEVKNYNNLLVNFFKILCEQGIIYKLSLKQNTICMNTNMNPIQTKDVVETNENKFVINTPTSIGLFYEHNTKTKQKQLNNTHHSAVYFGNYQSKTNECLVGILRSHCGKLRLETFDKQNECSETYNHEILTSKLSTSLVINIVCKQNSELLKFCNALVVIFNYRYLSEIYPDGVVECLMTDIDNVRLIYPFESYSEVPKSLKPAIVLVIDDIPNALDDYYQYQFVIESIAPVNKVHQRDLLEVWLVVHKLEQVNEKFIQNGDDYGCFLVLGDEYLSTVTFLDVGRSYILFSPQKLKPCVYNHEINKFSEKLKGFKLSTPEAYFLPLDKVASINLVTSIPQEQCTLNIKATLDFHFLNAMDTQPQNELIDCKNLEVNNLGMFGKAFQHRLVVKLDGTREKTVGLYMKNWDVKQTPEGLHPNVVLEITNVYYTGKYFNCNAFTDFKVVGVTDEVKQYNTAILNETNEIKNYESISGLQALDLKYFLYVRTRGYVTCFTGSLNLSLKRLNFRNFSFEVNDENGQTKLTCTKFDLLFKFMEINKEEIKECELLGQYKPTIHLNEVVQDVEVVDLQKNSPFLYLWLQHLYFKLNFGIVSIDVLCKKAMDGSWTIEDVFKVN